MSNENPKPGVAKRGQFDHAGGTSTPPISPSNDHAKNQQHQKHLGYGDQFPSNLLEEKTAEVRYKEQARKVGIIVTKSLLVINIYSSAFSGKIFNGDFIIKINNDSIKKKAQVYEALETFFKTHEKFTITVRRPKWLTPTNNVPKGYDLAPGYEYYAGLLVIYPNSTVGLNVKAFSSRVYVVRVEGDSIAVNTCLVGDCIVDVDGTPITTVNDCSEKIIKALKDKKYVMLTIERAATPMTIRAVRCALFAEKTMPIDPKLATDTQKIGEQEAAKIRSGKIPEPLHGILKSQGSGITGVSLYGTEKPHLEVRPQSEEYTIGCEPYNPLFFHKVKQRGQTNPDAASGPNTQQPTTSQLQQPSSGTGSSSASQAGTSGGSGEKVTTPASPDKFGPSVRRSKSRASTASKDDDSKRTPKKKLPTSPGQTALVSDTTSGNNTDLENSGKKLKDDDSKRGGKKSFMGTPDPSPQSPTPNNNGGEVDIDITEKKVDASKKGLRGRAAALKTAIMKPRNFESQKRKP